MLASSLDGHKDRNCFPNKISEKENAISAVLLRIGVVSKLLIFLHVLHEYQIVCERNLHKAVILTMSVVPQTL